MNLFRLISGASSAGLLAVGLSACLAEPNYSSTPEISFDNIQQIHISGSAPRDSIALTIRYQDGDGDLGLTSDEVSNKNGAYYGTRYANNFFVVPYVKDATGKFVTLASTGRFPNYTESTYYNRFDHVTGTADKRSLPIKGTLVWSQTFFPYSPFLPGEEVQFQVSIADRAKHDSNTIMTSSIFISK